MRISMFRKKTEELWRKIRDVLDFPSKVALGTVVSLAAAAQPSNAQSSTSNATVARPSSSNRQDTIRRYHEKFILTSSDSVVIRADTIWYPRRDRVAKNSDTAKNRGISSTPEKRTYPSVRPSTGGYGGHRSHMSHTSHSSHRSHRSHRSGGWV